MYVCICSYMLSIKLKGNFKVLKLNKGPNDLYIEQSFRTKL